MTKKTIRKAINIDSQTHKELKQLAIDEETSIINLITKLLKHYKNNNLK